MRGSTGRGAPTIFSAFLRTPTPTERPMLPGGYDFTHLVFWFVVALVALGTNFIPIVLTVGLGLLVLELIGRG